MVQKHPGENEFPPARPQRLFHPVEAPVVAFPIQSVTIDWDRLVAKRPTVLNTIDAMPVYLLKPEILRLIDAEKHPTFRLILDLMWTTGARVSEVLALRQTSFIDDGYDFGVILKTLKQRPGRPTRVALQRSPKRYIPIVDHALEDRIQSYLYAGHFKKTDRIFPMCRQTVNRHIHALVERVGGAPFAISAHTFRHSFAIHLLLHGRPLKYVSQLLGHKSVDSTEIYTNVLTVDGTHFLDGVDFH
ncbi:site-specific integrase [Aestuariirhabdus sp. Z084]|uniref:tyrosine-type recombinase/integrase n=1 Tax=Aestuariirhabdus haliotis TaxID=2918751 RepID=UPI00201B416C|nr:tyrosine-type recombinase/integrase [Aestuariirhabdus haliotis]MCL6414816.1 site-specific integrase [Aestuariirhabdus haliotis]MCL6418748.1 site-specific integrase [Aestuariirhabdus haliotis]